MMIQPSGKRLGRAAAIWSLFSLLAVLLLAITTPEGRAAAPEKWEARKNASSFVVHVYKKGALSALAHDHHFVPERWRATGTFNPNDPRVVDIEVEVDARSLRDDQPDLSEEDRKKVEKQARELLEADKHPTIRFTATRLDLQRAGKDKDYYSGNLQGHLELRGVKRALRIPVSARWSAGELRINGSAVFKQSDFGIEPYSTALGAIAVKDAVKVEFSLRARPQS